MADREPEEDPAAPLIEAGDAALSRKQWAAAFAAYHQAVDIRRELVRTLATPESRRNLAEALLRLGSTAQTRGYRAAALVFYQEAVDIHRELARTLGTSEAPGAP